MILLEATEIVRCKVYFKFFKLLRFCLDKRTAIVKHCAVFNNNMSKYK